MFGNRLIGCVTRWLAVVVVLLASVLVAPPLLARNGSAGGNKPSPTTVSRQVARKCIACLNVKNALAVQAL